MELHDGSTLSLDELLVECNVGRHRNEHLGLQDVANAVGIVRSTLAGLTTLTRGQKTKASGNKGVSVRKQRCQEPFLQKTKVSGTVFVFFGPSMGSESAFQAKTGDNIR